MKKFKEVSIVNDIMDATAVTHVAPFHADEVFATAMLSLMGKVRVFRTRDLNLIKKAKAEAGKDLVIYDVGGEYNPGQNLYDHHQKSFEEYRSDLVKYSSAGLIWKHFSGLILGNFGCPLNLIVEVAGTVDYDLIRGVDAKDNGQTNSNVEMSVSEVISLLNPNWDEEAPDHDKAFLTAVKLAQEVLDAKIRSAISTVIAREKVEEMIVSGSGEILEMPSFVGGWVRHILTSPSSRAKQLLFCVFPNLNGDWNVQAIPPSAEKPMGQRKALPEAWRGLSGEELAKVSGVQTAVFCHANGFIAGAKTREDALKLARLAVSL